MNGLKSNIVDVAGQIELMDSKPELVVLNETKNDEGDKNKEVSK